jgi:hypothetical protein
MAEMEGMEALQTPQPQTPQPSCKFKVGDLVHVYNGTCAGTRGYKTIAYMGTVVGYDKHQSKWLVCAAIVVHCFLNLPDIPLCSSPVQVRNSMLAKKGQPNREEETFMSRYLAP